MIGLYEPVVVVLQDGERRRGIVVGVVAIDGRVAYRVECTPPTTTRSFDERLVKRRGREER